VEIIHDILQAVILTISGYLVSQEKSWDVVSRRQPKNFSPAQKGFLERIVRGEVLVSQESMAGNLSS
jgi:hypothetical protein